MIAFVLVGLLFTPWLLTWGLWLLLALAGWRTPSRQENASADPTTPLDILIPAHNEAASLPALLASLRAQTHPQLLGTVLVVADHCTDATAAIARHWGATVLDRRTGPPGKPAAVRDGLAELARLGCHPGCHAGCHASDAQFASEACEEPVDIRHALDGTPNPIPSTAPTPSLPHSDTPTPLHPLLFLDADCICSPNLLAALSAELAAGRQVLQAAYELSPVGGTLSQPVRVAFALKNLLRPRGLQRLGLPCQLFGTGMAFRRDVLAHVHFEDHLVEDVRISHALLDHGTHIHFLPHARVTSPMPADRAALTRQRLRWEGGQLHTSRQAAALALRLLARGQWRPVLALLDWSAPPLVLGVLTWFLMTAVAIAVVCYGHLPAAALLWPALALTFLAAYLTVGVLALDGLAGLLALARHAPAFLAWKLAVYTRMATGRGARTWEKTPRVAEAAHD